MDSSKLSLFSEEKAGQRIVWSMMIQGLSAFLFIALYSYCQALSTLVPSDLRDVGYSILPPDKMLVGLWGSQLAHFLIIDAFGISAFFLPLFLLTLSLKLLFPKPISFRKTGGTTLFMMVWTAIALGYFYPTAEDIRWYRMPGGIASSFSPQLKAYIGYGVLIFLGFSLIAFLLVIFGIIYKQKKDEEPIMEVNSRRGAQFDPSYRSTRKAHYTSFPHAELRSAYFSFQSQGQRTPPPPFHTPLHNEETPAAAPHSSPENTNSEKEKDFPQTSKELGYTADQISVHESNRELKP